MHKGPWILAEYVKPIIAKGIRDHQGTENLAFACKVNSRQLYAIEHDFRYVSFDLLDKILVGTDQEYLWHIPSKDGGFEDLIVETRRRSAYTTCVGCGRPNNEVTEGCSPCKQRESARKRYAERRRKRYLASLEGMQKAIAA